MWNEKDAENALRFLQENDEEFGLLKGQVLGLEKQEKIIFGAEYLEQEGTVDERKSAAYNSTAYKEWKDAYETAATDLHILTAKRITKQSFIEAWRSVYSGRKRGNV
jgi:hypothetical protein